MIKILFLALIGKVVYPFSEPRYFQFFILTSYIKGHISKKCSSSHLTVKHLETFSKNKVYNWLCIAPKLSKDISGVIILRAEAQ